MWKKPYEEALELLNEAKGKSINCLSVSEFWSRPKQVIQTLRFERPVAGILLYFNFGEGIFKIFSEYMNISF